MVLRRLFFPYCLGKCPKPLKNRDVVMLRPWQVLDNSYIILNFSVKHWFCAVRVPGLELVPTIADGFIPSNPTIGSFGSLANSDSMAGVPTYLSWLT